LNDKSIIGSDISEFHFDIAPADLNRHSRRNSRGRNYRTDYLHRRITLKPGAETAKHPTTFLVRAIPVRSYAGSGKKSSADRSAANPTAGEAADGR
jgi:hypothetical protein